MSDCSYNIRFIFKRKPTYFWKFKELKYFKNSIEVFKF